MATLKTKSQKIALQAALDCIAMGGREIDPYAAAERNRSGQNSTKSGPVTNLQEQLKRAANTAKKMGAEEFAGHIETLEMLAEFLRSADDISLPAPNTGAMEILNQEPLKALCKTRDRSKAGTIGPTVNLIRIHLPDAHYSQVYDILRECGQLDITRDAVKSLWRTNNNDLPPS